MLLGPVQYDVGQMQGAQFGTMTGQAKSGHQAPMVRIKTLFKRGRESLRVGKREFTMRTRVVPVFVSKLTRLS